MLGHAPGTLERYQLPAEVQKSLEELRELSKRAEDGDQVAGRELKRKLRKASPAVVARASDVGRQAQHMLIKTIAAGDPLTEYALSGRLDMMREEIAGERPTPLEALLTERIVSLWMFTTVLEALLGAQYQKAMDGKRSSPSYIIQHSRILESASRRYLAAIRELARVRKLQAHTPAVQFNTQINVR